MDGREYLDVTNLTKLRAARTIIGDCCFIETVRAEVKKEILRAIEFEITILEDAVGSKM